MSERAAATRTAFEIGGALLLAACLFVVADNASGAPGSAATPQTASQSAPHSTSQTRPAAIPSVSRAQALAAGCTPCHQAGVNSNGALSGKSREALRATLERYRDGTLPGTVMPQIARGYTPEELDLIAQWFAAGHGSP